MVGGKRYIVAQNYEGLLGLLSHADPDGFVQVRLWLPNGNYEMGALALRQIVSLRPWVA